MRGRSRSRASQAWPRKSPTRPKSTDTSKGHPTTSRPTVEERNTVSDVRGRSGGEDAEREVGRHSPVGTVHDLTDLEVGGEAAEHVGVLRAQVMLMPQPADQVAHRILAVLHQVGPQRTGGEVSQLV